MFNSHLIIFYELPGFFVSRKCEFIGRIVETTEEECFSQQQKVFISVFSISFSLAGYLVFNSAKSLRIRPRSYTNYRHSSTITRLETMLCLKGPSLQSLTVPSSSMTLTFNTHIPS